MLSVVRSLEWTAMILLPLGAARERGGLNERGGRRWFVITNRVNHFVNLRPCNRKIGIRMSDRGKDFFHPLVGHIPKMSIPRLSLLLRLSPPIISQNLSYAADRGMQGGGNVLDDFAGGNLQGKYFARLRILGMIAVHRG